MLKTEVKWKLGGKYYLSICVYTYMSEREENNYY